MIETIKFEGEEYPKFQAIGHASQFIKPVAEHVCKGIGYDIGYSKEEWQLPGSIGVDSSYFEGVWHALNLPKRFIDLKIHNGYINLIPMPLEDDKESIKIWNEWYKNNFLFADIDHYNRYSSDNYIKEIDKVDYIFSSHCLEHLPNYVTALDYWMDNIKSGGTLLLYLPHKSQKYWAPWSNRKHIHSLDQELIKAYFDQRWDIAKLFISGVDLNHSFAVMVEKV